MISHSHHRKPKKNHPWRHLKSSFAKSKDSLDKLKLMFELGKQTVNIKIS